MLRWYLDVPKDGAIACFPPICPFCGHGPQSLPAHWVEDLEYVPPMNACAGLTGKANVPLWASRLVSRRG